MFNDFEKAGLTRRVKRALLDELVAQFGVAAVAQHHLDAALPHLGDDYMGEHWLATFALLALERT